MFNPKLLGVSAGVGFVLSLIVGLTAGVSFGMLILRAFLSGVVCAVLAFTVDFLGKKFLSVSAEDSVPIQQTGSSVDITVEDEDLPDDKNGPTFYVTDGLKTHSMSGLDNSKSTQEYKSVDLGNNTKESENFTAASMEAFKPIDLAGNGAADLQNEKVNTAKNSSYLNGNSAFKDKPSYSNANNNSTSESTISVEKPNKSDVSFDDSLEDLPDIGALVPDFKESDVTVIKDSQFATGKQSSSSSGDREDAQVMAQAIRTILSKDG